MHLTNLAVLPMHTRIWWRHYKNNEAPFFLIFHKSNLKMCYFHETMKTLLHSLRRSIHRKKCPKIYHNFIFLLEVLKLFNFFRLLLVVEWIIGIDDRFGQQSRLIGHWLFAILMKNWPKIRLNWTKHLKVISSVEMQHQSITSLGIIVATNFDHFSVCCHVIPV